MKKLFTARHLSLLLLLSLFGGKAVADRAYDDERCFGRDYECACNALNCGSFGLQFQAGVYPIVWTKRGDLNLVNCTFVSPITNPVGSLGKLNKFSGFFKTPWTVGGKVSYAMSDCTDIFVEFNYAQAKSKDCSCSSEASCASTCTTSVTPLNPIGISLSKYKLFNAYFGARYYFNRVICDRVSFFLGEKVGLVHHKSVGFNSLLLSDCGGDCSDTCSTASCSTSCSNNFFDRNTVVSGGFNVGADICFCGNWAFVITAEVVASCGPRSNGNIVLSTTDAAGLGGSNIQVGSVGTELSFPVTAGIKYNF